MHIMYPHRIVCYPGLRPLLRDMQVFPTSTCLMQMPRFLFPPELERLANALKMDKAQGRRLVPSWNYQFPLISHSIVRVVQPAYMSYNGCVRSTIAPYDMLEDVDYYIYKDHPDRRQ